MDSVQAQVAVLSVSGASPAGVAMESVVADSLTAAGHQITSFESVKDSETAIRSQLVGWIEDPDIDLVIIIGEGSSTSKAMAPLVDQPLPGFADLLRMLAFQEIGASAMLSHAEAAKCGSTFVFVLPMGENAVRAAMDKLILPQLDPNTQPKNLISEMPRFREEGEFTRVDTPSEVPTAPHESIPVAIPKERTAAGAGLVARPPAATANDAAKTIIDKAPEAPPGRTRPSTQSRVKSATGKNVIVRKVEDPTKPIELQKLERQIELSKATGDKTKPMLSRLPAVPPGADQETIQREVGEDTLKAAAKPVPAIVKPVPRNPAPLTTKQAMPLKSPARATPPMPSPIVQPAKVAGTAKDSGKPVISKRPALIVVDDAEPAELAPPPRARPKTAPPKPPVVEEAKPKPKSKPQAMVTEEIEPLEAEDLETIDRPAPVVAAPPAVRAANPEIHTEPIEPIEAEPERQTLERLLPAEPVPEPRTRPPTAPPQPKRAPTAPPPAARATSTATNLVDLPLPGNLDLPSGSFDYRVKRSRMPLVLGLLVVAGLAVGAVVLLQGRGGSTPERDAATEVAVVTPPTPDAAIEPTVADSTDEIEIDPTPVNPTPPTPTRPADRRDVKPPRPTPPPGDKPTPPPPDKPTPPPDKPTAPDPPVPTADPGCDESACVIEKYARPCCVRFKPTGDGFTPTVGTNDSLEKPQIKAGIERMKPAISRCGETHAAKGTVKVYVTVNGEGVVQSVEVQAAPDDDLGKCVAALVRKASFAKTVNGGSFSYPFVF